VRWIEVLAQATSDERAAALWAAQDEDLLALGLASRLLVLDLDELAPQLSAWAELGLAQAGEIDRLDKALESSLGIELEGYRVIARQSEGFDAVVELLLALDRDHHGLLTRLLSRLAAIGAERLDEEGPAELLSAAESLADDVAGAREDRRAAEGYISPSAAAAFLRLATQQAGELDTLLRNRERDPLTRAYFRELETRSVEAPASRDTATAAPSTRTHPLSELLTVAGVDVAQGADHSVVGALPAHRGAADDVAATLRAGLAALAVGAPEVHDQRLRELVYLANVLVAAGDVAGRRYAPAEAAEAALRYCGEAAWYLVERGDDLQTLLRDDGAASQREQLARVVEANVLDQRAELPWG
jgi:hypothetical protein